MGPRMLTLRGCLVSAALGLLFTFITLRLTLGSAGMTPPLTIPAGLLSYVLLKAFTRVFPRSSGPFSPQENAVAQTMATSCYKIVGYAGYSSYLIALSYPIYLQLGGVPRGEPGFNPDVVVDPDLHRIYPYLALIAFAGIFALLGLRRLLIVQWRLPFPSGAACGSMINSLHLVGAAAPLSDVPASAPAADPPTPPPPVKATAAAAAAAAAADAPPPPPPPPPPAAFLAAPAPAPGVGGRHHAIVGAAAAAAAAEGSTGVMPPDARTAAAVATSNQQAAEVAASGADPALVAANKVKVLAYTALGSLLFDVVKWLFQGPSYNCGFATWPTFGLVAAKWTWRLDFQQQYIGSGFLVPHVVAWSMLLGAILAWGIMWPQISLREGDWYPSGLSYGDMRGLGGYQIFTSVALLLGEGAFILGKAALLGWRQLRAHNAQQRLHRQQHQHHGISGIGAATLGTAAAGAAAGTHSSSAGRDAFAGTRTSREDLSCSYDEGGEPCQAISTSFCCPGADAAAGADVRLRVRPSAELLRHQQQQHQPETQQPASPVQPRQPSLLLHHWQQQQQQQQQEPPPDAEALLAGLTWHDSVKDADTSGTSGTAAAAAAGAAVRVAGWGGSLSGAAHPSRRCRGTGGGGSSGNSSSSDGGGGGGGRDEGDSDDGGVAGAVFRESWQERKLREAMFLGDTIPVWWAPVGYGGLAALGTALIPLVYPGARWYMVLVAFLCGPPVALVNGFGAGLTDVDNSGNFATVAMFVFASWAASTGGNGIVAGCIISGVLMVFSVSAAVLLQDLRTGYVTLTPPRAMLLAQCLGALFGVVVSPAAFALIWSSGQIGKPDGPYPAPFAAVTRGIVMLGTQGMAALPRHCAALAGAFFAAALAICCVREALPPRWGRFVPSPMGMAFPFFIPASAALDFWLGSVAVLVWEARAPASAAAYAPLVGAGLLVGDGLWSIPAAILAVANVAPPMCMKFS